MLRLAVDADVHGNIVRGFLWRRPELDLVRVQEALPEGPPDLDVLAWAAAENRTLITNARNTMVGFAHQRAAAGEPTPGVIVTTNQPSMGSAVDDILLIAVYMPEEEISDQVVVFLPFPRMIASTVASRPTLDEKRYSVAISCRGRWLL